MLTALPAGRMPAGLHRLSLARSRVRIPPGPPLCGPVAQWIEQERLAKTLVARLLSPRRNNDNEKELCFGECRWDYIDRKVRVRIPRGPPPSRVVRRRIGWATTSRQHTRRRCLDHAEPCLTHSRECRRDYMVEAPRGRAGSIPAPLPIGGCGKCLAKILVPRLGERPGRQRRHMKDMTMSDKHIDVTACRRRRADQDVDARRAGRRQGARSSSSRAAQMPFIFKHVAAMPDVHVGIGATVGSVIPTKGAVIPAAVGVDIGCGMMAARTSLMRQRPAGQSARASAPRSRRRCRMAAAVDRGKRDTGSWGDAAGRRSSRPGRRSPERFDRIMAKYPRLANTNNLVASRHARHGQPLHRGLPRYRAARVGHAALGLARRRQCDRQLLHRAGQAGHAQVASSTCPTRTSPTSRKGPSISTTMSRRSAGRRTSPRSTARMMMTQRDPRRCAREIAKPFDAELEAVNCHHNYVTRENHFGENVLVTRKGAVRAAKGVLGIIPGSMGAKIVHRARPRQRGSRSTAAAMARAA